MTTIAYKNGIIAYDSRRCAGDTIVDDDYEKRVDSDGATFFFTGAVAEIPEFILVYFGGQPRAALDGTAMVVDGGKVWLASIDKEIGFWKEEVYAEKPYAIGSGAMSAWTAMDMGASAEHAVKMAKKRDKCTGGRVRTFEVTK